MIPCLNRDGDLLSDLVLPLFGSIAGAESILLALDAELAPSVAMAEAPHGTAPALEGKDLANPMAMILACAALLHGDAPRGRADRRGTARPKWRRGRSMAYSRRSLPELERPISVAMPAQPSSPTR